MSMRKQGFQQLPRELGERREWAGGRQAAGPLLLDLFQSTRSGVGGEGAHFAADEGSRPCLQK